MKRREFMVLSAAMAVAPMAARASETLDYTPGLVRERLASGETVFVDFKASWCTTCRAQERVIGQLRADNPAYDEAITFINVDWDEHGRGELATELNIPRRSTLVVMKGEEELGRVVARTSRGDIQALMDTALAASGAS
ncbi:thioredoxin family protein [Cognatiyoonia sp. IB215446]|uniref:thioredoxin family protein n=1 Tax=Cognatiyoonia sp. IB215446 TaxID=3097355 RepID=UPI002A0F6BDD|nr:thioredoxin family protein [Cognatiyoonia sp. IB215446]MDX8349164.1 thioredoxin family protein [Cognatiyoonia sp. IB215446]